MTGLLGRGRLHPERAGHALLAQPSCIGAGQTRSIGARGRLSFTVACWGGCREPHGRLSQHPLTHEGSAQLPRAPPPTGISRLSPAQGCMCTVRGSHPVDAWCRYYIVFPRGGLILSYTRCGFSREAPMEFRGAPASPISRDLVVNDPGGSFFFCPYHSPDNHSSSFHTHTRMRTHILTRTTHGRTPGTHFSHTHTHTHTT